MTAQTDETKGILGVALTLFRQVREEHIYYSAVTFRRLLDSLARPGKLNQLAYPSFPGEPPTHHDDSATIPLNFYALAAFSTLLDGETSFILAANGRWFDQTAPSVQWLTLRSGARAAAPHAADFAFFSDGKSGSLLAELSGGTLLEPESSATVFYCVEQLTDPNLVGSSTSNGQSVTLKLMGPGIQEHKTVSVAGLSYEEIGFIQDTRKNYPLGIDIFLIDTTGQCLGLPRTTRIHRA